jgi:uncharacterized membrane protein YqaE (UPF0057 family)
MSWFKLPRASHTIAFASMAAFGIQVIFALLMLRFFTPEEVGEYSVLSQIGFFWTTLALAQAPLSLLANSHLPAALATQQAWGASVLRAAGLFPIAALAIWFSQLHLWPSLLWVALLAFFQLAWMLAQSFTLRAGSSWQQAGVRVLPPLTAALTALCGALIGAALDWRGPTLVISAVLGYAVGALWLAPALVNRVDTSTQAEGKQLETFASQSDTRSTSLRMAHTLVDALLATAIVLVWQRLYGSEETGWMNALLRVLGFIPALVHLAWSQVMLSQGAAGNEKSRFQALAIGGLGCLSVLFFGAVCAAALQREWLDPKWLGLWTYLIPLIAWQGAACLSAALSYRPFQCNAASRYSWGCMGLALVQAGVLFYPVWFEPLDVWAHLSAFAFVSALGLLVLSAWMFSLKTLNTSH